jgi:FlaA1/EpsC-like NDP-sugar epimerase
MPKTNTFLDNKKILVIGGTGSWGSELVKQLIYNHHPKEIRIFSRGEHKQVEMRHTYRQVKNLRFIIGDIRDAEAVDIAASGVDAIFNLAALKHVPVCEENPWEAVKTNIIGTQYVIEAATANNIKKVVYVSSDKGHPVKATLRSVSHAVLMARSCLQTPAKCTVNST